MTQLNCSAGCACPSPCTQVETELTDTAPRTVSAGGVCGADCATLDAPISTQTLAQIRFPIQSSKTGFCPCEALCKGTLFPELVSPFTRGCCS